MHTKPCVLVKYITVIYLFRLQEQLRSIVNRDECVCLCVCPTGYLWNHRHDLYQFFVHTAYVRGSVLLRYVDDRLHRLLAGRGWRDCTAQTKCNLWLPCANYFLLQHTKNHDDSQIFDTTVPHHHTTTVLRPFFPDHPGEPVPEQNFWTSWCKGRLTEANTLTIRLGATPSWLTSAHLYHPPIFFTGRMPFLPPNRVKALKATSAFRLGRRC